MLRPVVVVVLVSKVPNNEPFLKVGGGCFAGIMLLAAPLKLADYGVLGVIVTERPYKHSTCLRQSVFRPFTRMATLGAVG